MYENLVLNSNWWTLWATYHFFLIQKHLYVSCHQEGIHYCTTHKYRDSSWCFQTHPKIWSLLYFDIVSQL